MVASHPVLPWPIPSVRRPPEMSSSVMRTAAPARSRTQTGAAAKLTKLARVPTAAGSKRAGVQLLHHRDDHAAPLLRALLHRGRKQTCSPRRLHTNPTGAWVTQQARNLNLTHVLERTRFLIRDQATKFGGSLDEVFHGERHQDDSDANPGATGQRLRRAVRAHRPCRVPRLAADPQPPPVGAKTPVRSTGSSRFAGATEWRRPPRMTPRNRGVDRGDQLLRPL
jgi:hypothetical protein